MAVIQIKNDMVARTDNVVIPFVNPEIKLKKDGTPKKTKCNKVKGRKSEVYAFDTEDAKKVVEYLSDNEMWLHYMIFVLSCNMARRIGDILSLKWYHVFNPTTGKFRADLLEIQEDKTDKLANPRINTACRAAIELYTEKTKCNPSDEQYSKPMCLQLSGTHKGNVLSYGGYRKSLKKAGEAVGIDYNIGTHSARKTFGMLNRMLHPGDYDSMEILQTIYNHSDSKTTKRYIGLTKQKVDKYYDDMGNFFNDYITGEKEFENVSKSPIISIETHDLRDVIKMAYEAGRKNAGEADVIAHIEAINNIMEVIEDLTK